MPRAIPATPMRGEVHVPAAHQRFRETQLADPETGNHFDDAKRYIDALPIPRPDKESIFEKNARRVLPRLDSLLKSKGR